MPPSAFKLQTCKVLHPLWRRICKRMTFHRQSRSKATAKATAVAVKWQRMKGKAPAATAPEMADAMAAPARVVQKLWEILQVRPPSWFRRLSKALQYHNKRMPIQLSCAKRPIQPPTEFRRSVPALSNLTPGKSKKSEVLMLAASGHYSIAYFDHSSECGVLSHY